MRIYSIAPFRANQPLALRPKADIRLQRTICREGPISDICAGTVHEKNARVQGLSFWVLVAFSLFARSLVPICKG